jgi:predicted O-methyltransferase YrrM
MRFGFRSAVERVNTEFARLPYMSKPMAAFIDELVRTHDLRSLLELGTFKGKGTAYLAAILEDRGGDGHVTTLDKSRCLQNVPNVNEVLGTLGLSHRASVRLHPRSFTMTLMTMLEETPRPQFDFCYLDGAHLWEGTGFCFFLVDLMLKPGGWIILDDLDWTMAGFEKSRPNAPKSSKLSAEEKEMRQVRKVWDLLVRGSGYINMSEPIPGWGLAQKPGR